MAGASMAATAQRRGGDRAEVHHPRGGRSSGPRGLQLGDASLRGGPVRTGRQPSQPGRQQQQQQQQQRWTAAHHRPPSARSSNGIGSSHGYGGEAAKERSSRSLSMGRGQPARGWQNDSRKSGGFSGGSCLHTDDGGSRGYHDSAGQRSSRPPSRGREIFGSVLDQQSGQLPAWGRQQPAHREQASAYSGGGLGGSSVSNGSGGYAYEEDAYHGPLPRQRLSWRLPHDGYNDDHDSSGFTSRGEGPDDGYDGDEYERQSDLGAMQLPPGQPPSASERMQPRQPPGVRSGYGLDGAGLQWKSRFRPSTSEAGDTSDACGQVRLM